jgi:hypothetical protein
MSMPSERTLAATAGPGAEHLAGLGDQHGGGLLELGERALDRLVPLHERDRRRHHLGHVGLQGIGVAEDPLEQLAVADRPDELRDVGGLLAHDGRLGDRARL